MDLYYNYKNVTNFMSSKILNKVVTCTILLY